MEEERKLPPRKKVGPFNIDTMPPGTRRRAEEKNKGIRSRNVARAMSSSKDTPRRDTGDRPVVTKKNRGQQPTRRKARSLPRNVAKEMDPKGPPKGTESSLKRSKPAVDKPKVDTKPSKPKVDAKVTPKAKSTPVTKRPQVTGKGSRNVTREGPMGKRTLANVTKEQLTTTGMSLRQYLNYMDKNDGKRPPKKKAESKTPRRTGSARPMSERKFAKGGMMKSKMKAKGMKAGGKMKAKGMAKGGMKTKGYMAGGLKDAPEGNKGLKKLPKQVRNKMGFKAKGGMMKTKGYAKGGMKTKGYMAGGKMKAKGMAKGGKVRGAGIARKGVRPVKMR